MGRSLSPPADQSLFTHLTHTRMDGWTLAAAAAEATIYLRRKCTCVWRRLRQSAGCVLWPTVGRRTQRKRKVQASLILEHATEAAAESATTRREAAHRHNLHASLFEWRQCCKVCAFPLLLLSKQVGRANHQARETEREREFVSFLNFLEKKLSIQPQPRELGERSREPILFCSDATSALPSEQITSVLCAGSLSSSSLSRRRYCWPKAIGPVPSLPAEGKSYCTARCLLPALTLAPFFAVCSRCWLASLLSSSAPAAADFLSTPGA